MRLFGAALILFGAVSLAMSRIRHSYSLTSMTGWWFDYVLAALILVGAFLIVLGFKRSAARAQQQREDAAHGAALGWASQEADKHRVLIEQMNASLALDEGTCPKCGNKHPKRRHTGFLGSYAPNGEVKCPQCSCCWVPASLPSDGTKALVAGVAILATGVFAIVVFAFLIWGTLSGQFIGGPIKLLALCILIPIGISVEKIRYGWQVLSGRGQKVPQVTQVKAPLVGPGSDYPKADYERYHPVTDSILRRRGARQAKVPPGWK